MFPPVSAMEPTMLRIAQVEGPSKDSLRLNGYAVPHCDLRGGAATFLLATTGPPQRRLC
jgi:hypothetical protein